MKINWKSRILYAILTGLLYGVILYLISYFNNDVSYSFKQFVFQTIFFGAFFGIGFPFLLNRIITQLIAKIKTPEINNPEKIILEGRANLFRGRFIAIGGKLLLTNKRLIFNSHKYNIQNSEISINLDEISEILGKKTYGIINNGLSIKLKNNLKYNFVVNQQSKWLEQLKKSTL